MLVKLPDEIDPETGERFTIKRYRSLEDGRRERLAACGGHAGAR